jgi:hypothetical protein
MRNVNATGDNYINKEIKNWMNAPLTHPQKKQIAKVVKKVVQQYGETLKLLGNPQ